METDSLNTQNTPADRLASCRNPGPTSETTTSGAVTRDDRPQTQAGNNRSRANALQHGLTALTLVHESFPEGEIERFQQTFGAEWKATTPTAQFLVEELARHAAALRRAQKMECAVLRQGARAAIALSPAHDLEECGPDLLQAGSVTSEGIERLTRYRRCHEKAFFAALNKLQDIRAFSPQKLPDGPRPWPFQTEEECRLHLRRRFEHPDHRCPACGGAPGCWLTNRDGRVFAVIADMVWGYPPCPTDSHSCPHPGDRTRHSAPRYGPQAPDENPRCAAFPGQLGIVGRSGRSL